MNKKIFFGRDLALLVVEFPQPAECAGSVVGICCVGKIFTRFFACQSALSQRCYVRRPFSAVIAETILWRNWMFDEKGFYMIV